LSLRSNTKEDLSSKVVLITGASSGLGEALAHAFCKRGCKVILAARRLEELKRVQSDLLNAKPNYEPVIVKLDLEDFNSIPAIINKILEDHGRIDILVNNGGVSVRGSALATSIEVDIKIMNTNYLGTIALTKAILPSMIKQGEGRIVFISSVQGKFAIPHRSAYSASKHAIQAFTDSLRAEVHRDNVKVTCISPGYIKTSLSKNALTGDGSKHGQMDSTTNNGVEPEVMANDIILALLKKWKGCYFSAKFSSISILFKKFLSFNIFLGDE